MLSANGAAAARDVRARRADALDHGAAPPLIAWARVAMGAVMPFSALSVGEQHVSSSLAGILAATTPLFVGAMAVPSRPCGSHAVPLGALLLGDTLRASAIHGLALILGSWLAR